MIFTVGEAEKALCHFYRDRLNEDISVIIEEPRQVAPVAQHSFPSVSYVNYPALHKEINLTELEKGIQSIGTDGSNKIKVIKFFREATGSSLAFARWFIENLPSATEQAKATGIYNLYEYFNRSKNYQYLIT